MTLEQEIDALLPQTQCTKCGYAGCRPYAEAIAAGRADIDQCPPGGAAGIEKLARLLQRAPKPLNPAYGLESPRTAASIDEALCIGCTLCIRACPVDAIVGAPKQMHTVLIAQCTGCELCLPPCPVDCIELLPLRALAARGASVAAEQADTPVATHAPRWRHRFEQRERRLARERHERDARLAAKAEEQRRTLPAPQPGAASARKRAAVRAALARARARRASLG